MFIHVFYEGFVHTKAFDKTHEAWHALYNTLEEKGIDEVFVSTTYDTPEYQGVPFFWRRITKNRYSHLNLEKIQKRNLDNLATQLQSWFN